MRSSDGGATIFARGVGPACTSSSAALTNRGIARQRASTRLLHQPEGSGAEQEDRLVYAEGLCDVESALDLLARHIVDQRASNLLFGDRRRLQEDLLADAASTEVRKFFPKVRGCPSGAQRRAQ
jgi:hypothetical protein